MASSRSNVKQSAGWGGFLQQAVLSVESRLDTILADDDQPSTKANGQQSSRKASTDISRSSSASKTNDRLQERLARAMAKKKGDSYNDSPASTSEFVPKTASPVLHVEQELKDDPTRKSTDSENPIEVPSITTNETASIIGSVPNAEQNYQDSGARVAGSVEQQSEFSAFSQVSTPPRPSLDDDTQSQKSHVIMNGMRAPSAGASPEEMYSYIEKIDALQAKLLYLSQEAAASAHEAAAAAKSGSIEKKMLEKDEKIALLMEEGQQLSKTEMKHLMTIKKLRSEAAENAKNQSSIKARAELVDANLHSVEERAESAEAAMRRAEESLSISLDADRDLEALKSERDALTITITEIRSQLANTTKKAEKVETKAQSELIGREKKQIADLKDDLSSAKVEREISEGKLRREIKEKEASLEQERENSETLKAELQAEQSMLESKMESLRNRAEEASSSSVGDVEARSLRQIETLQNQYSVARENWQGIEGSLMARIANAEKERAALAQREDDVRKRLRETTLKAKSGEKENERSRDELYRLEQAMSEQMSSIRRLERKASETEEALADAKRELECKQQTWETELSRRVEEEKNNFREHFTPARAPISGNASPIGSTRKHTGLGIGLEHTGPSLVPGRSQSRRSSTMPHAFRNASTTSQQNSLFGQFPVNGTDPETPASQLAEEDEYFPETPRSLSMSASRGLNDLVSASTVGAGPSVQLVERMSASVRRLESEKAATKDDVARLTTQRDDSRKEVVALMREVEQKRASEDRIKALEEELRQVDQRHQTTLEMLGEKSELVEELRADIADVKEMYRDLVDSTMK